MTLQKTGGGTSPSCPYHRRLMNVLYECSRLLQYIKSTVYLYTTNTVPKMNTVYKIKYCTFLVSIKYLNFIKPTVQGRNQLRGRGGGAPPVKCWGPSKMWLFIFITRRKREKQVLSLAQYYHNTSKVS